MIIFCDDCGCRLEPTNSVKIKLSDAQREARCARIGFKAEWRRCRSKCVKTSGGWKKGPPAKRPAIELSLERECKFWLTAEWYAMAGRSKHYFTRQERVAMGHDAAWRNR